MTYAQRSERGQMVPLVALLVAAVGLACLGLGRFGRDAAEHARARTAADAAALAGAAAGESAASRLAAANGASLRSFERAGQDARVEVVAARGARARARARVDQLSVAAAASPEPTASWSVRSRRSCRAGWPVGKWLEWPGEVVGSDCSSCVGSGCSAKGLGKLAG